MGTPQHSFSAARFPKPGQPRPKHRECAVGARHRRQSAPGSAAAGSVPRRSRRTLVTVLPGAAIALLVVAAVVVGSVAGGRPDSVSGPVTTSMNVTPVADTFSSPATPRLVNGAKTYLTASSRSGSLHVIYLRFVIPSADVSLVQEAQLVLTRTSHHLSGTLSARSVASATWSGATLSAANAPSVGAVLDTTTSSRTDWQVGLDVTSGVRGRSTVDLAVTSSSTTDFVQFTSREANNNPPVLHLSLAQPGGSATGSSSSPPSKSASSKSTTPTKSATPTDSGASSSTPSASTSTGSPTTQPSAGGLVRPNCSISSMLVPACGRWLGVAPLPFTNTPLQSGLAREEQMAGRPMDILHVYHVNGQLFPTATEKSLALAPGANRILLMNWKPATDMSWAAVAAGGADARIDKLATYINQTFPYRFFLTIWHEPENDVVAKAGSGMTASDYVAMYRHVVLRLRADGLTKAVTVMNYMGFDNWARQSWFSQLWPGNDVVDWIALDPYAVGPASSNYRANDFQTLVNRPDGSFPGFYSWATKTYPGKPIMLAEWGVAVNADQSAQAKFFRSMTDELGEFPDIKALVYFNMPKPQSPGWETYLAATTSGETAYQQVVRSPAMVAPQFRYSS